MMARVRPEQKRHLNGARICVLLATASAAALSYAIPLQAQEAGLRGAVSETAARDALLWRKRPAVQPAADAQAQAPAYQPASPGAVPDQPATTTEDIFSEPPNADAASNYMRPPTTARQRAEDERRRRAALATGASPSPAPAAPAEDQPAAAVRQPTVDAGYPLENGPEAVRKAAIESRYVPRDDSPFAPVGIRVGSFVLRPSLEQGLTATSNADSTPEGGSAVLSETALRLNAVSDWERHSATVDAYGLFRDSVSGEEFDDAAAGINGRLELDLANQMRAIARLGYNVRPESAYSPVVTEETTSEPLLHTFDGGLELEKDIGKVRLGVAGDVVREVFGEADLVGGGTLSQDDRNQTLYSGRLRTGYEISPALTPFGEIEYGRRVYDLRFDTAGFQRSANLIGARAGLEIDMGEKFGGEISAGWISEDLDDDRLQTISAPSVAADLRWSPMRGTIVGLNAATVIEGSTTPGESGSVLYLGRLSVERQLRSNLTGLAAVGAGWRDYAGTDEHELALSAEAELTWWINRYAGLVGRVRHENLDSSLPDRDSETNSVFLGLRFQR